MTSAFIFEAQRPQPSGPGHPFAPFISKTDWAPPSFCPNRSGPPNSVPPGLPMKRLMSPRFGRPMVFYLRCPAPGRRQGSSCKPNHSPLTCFSNNTPSPVFLGPIPSAGTRIHFPVSEWHATRAGFWTAQTAARVFPHMFPRRKVFGVNPRVDGVTRPPEPPSFFFFLSLPLWTPRNAPPAGSPYLHFAKRLWMRRCFVFRLGRDATAQCCLRPPSRHPKAGFR